jgi:hypothetical protein
MKPTHLHASFNTAIVSDYINGEITCSSCYPTLFRRFAAAHTRPTDSGVCNTDKFAIPKRQKIYDPRESVKEIQAVYPDTEDDSGEWLGEEDSSEESEEEYGNASDCDGGNVRGLISEQLESEDEQPKRSLRLLGKRSRTHTITDEPSDIECSGSDADLSDSEPLCCSDSGVAVL